MRGKKIGNSKGHIEYHWAKNSINFESARAPLHLIGMNKYIQASIAHKRMDHTKSVIALVGTKLFTDTGYFIISAQSSLQPISKHYHLYTLPETNKFAPEKRPSKKETIVFQRSIFRCQRAVSFREGKPLNHGMATRAVDEASSWNSQQWDEAHTADGSEIAQSPVEVGSWNHIIYRVLYLPGG